MRFLHWISNRFIHTGARWIVHRGLDLRVEGIEHVPLEGPVVIAARHYHHAFDGAAIFATARRPLSLIVALDWVRSRFGRFAMERLARLARFPTLLREEALLPDANGHVLHADSAYTPDEVRPYGRRCLRDAARLLTDGGALVVFPEAYPNVDPHASPKEGADGFLAFRGGFVAAAEMAARRLGHPVAIVPAGLAYEPGKRWSGVLRFGPPLHAPDPRGAKELTREVEEQVRALSRPVHEPALGEHRGEPVAT